MTKFVEKILKPLKLKQIKFKVKNLSQSRRAERTAPKPLQQRPYALIKHEITNIVSLANRTNQVYQIC